MADQIFDYSNFPIFLTPLSAITPQHIDVLVRDRVRESRYLDYKRDVYPATDEGKVQLLKHVCGFANSGGGLLIFGIEEEREEPIRVTGTGVQDADVHAIRRAIHECIQPTIYDAEARIIDHPSGRLLILRIAKGTSVPHMVSYRNHHRFYTRFGTDTVPMTIHEIRNAFTQLNTDGLRMLLANSFTKASPVNETFLRETYNAIASGDTDGAKRSITEYIQKANTENGSRDSSMNALFIDEAGNLSTASELQRYARALAKANTYFKGTVEKVDAAIDSLHLLHHFLQETAQWIGEDGVQEFNKEGLIREKNEVDYKYDTLVQKLKNLAKSLERKRRSSKQTGTKTPNPRRDK